MPMPFSSEVTLDILIQQQPDGSEGRRVLEAYRDGRSVAAFALDTPEAQQAAVQGAALLGDAVTFHRALDAANTPLSWATDAHHPFYLAYDNHHDDLLERVADAQMIGDMADQLSNVEMSLVDPFLAAGVMAGVREPAEQWIAVFKSAHRFPRSQKALVARLALERNRQADDLSPEPAPRRPRVRA
jgi:hypothetical protein